LLGTLKIKLDGKYYDRSFRIDFDEAGQLTDLTLPINTWICVPSLSPELARGAVVATDPICATNGLISLQHGLLLNERYDASSIGIVHRIQSRLTGEAHEHQRYDAFFKSLKKLITPELVYASVQEFPDGNRVEDTKLQRMTEGAVRAASEGVRFTRTPGRRLATGASG
jgi:hypothetical protein